MSAVVHYASYTRSVIPFNVRGETWTLRNVNEREAEALDMWIYGKIVGVRCAGRLRSDEC